MSRKQIPVILVDPVTTKIKHSFDSMKEAAQFLGVSRQAVHCALRENTRVKGLFVYTKSSLDNSITITD